MIKELRDAEAQLEATSKALEQAVEEQRKAAGEPPEGEAADSPAGKPGDAEKVDKAAQNTENLKKALGTNRGIETMFRSAYRVQMDLTGLADNKANMMISINGIIISIIIAAVAPKLDANPWLLVPTTVFLTGTLVSIIYAIIAARPRVDSTPISLEDLHHSRGNILFFGDYSKLSVDDFLEGMVGLVQDRTMMYETMIRNLYGLGSVLRKKFSLLEVAYNSFMLALILGVGSFIGVFIWILIAAPGQLPVG